MENAAIWQRLADAAPDDDERHRFAPQAPSPSAAQKRAD